MQQQCVDIPSLAGDVRRSSSSRSTHRLSVATVSCAPLTAHPALPGTASPGVTAVISSRNRMSGVPVHLITVRALPTASASKRSKPVPVSVSFDDLIQPDAVDDSLS